MELAQKYEIGAVKDFITEHITSEWPATLSEWRCQQAEIARLEEILCSSCNAAREREAHALRVEITHAALTSANLPADRASGEARG